MINQSIKILDLVEFLNELEGLDEYFQRCVSPSQ